MKLVEKKALLEKLSEHGLGYEVLNFSRRTIIIHDATGHTSRRMGELSEKIEKAGLADNTNNALYTLYVPLMACSEGDLPKSYDDFFWMKNEDIETWTQKARAMNPRLFGLLDLQERKLKSLLNEEEQAKKKPKRSRSR